MKKPCLYLLLFILPILVYCQDKDQAEFDRLYSSSDWSVQLSDPCTDDWQTHWFLDGEIATVDNHAGGMNFSAGPVNRNDAHHAVLWTKKSFAGDIKMEYSYTRTDSQLINVNILYIQANGIGESPFVRDISAWNDLRKVPKMSTYFRNMNALHISYAAFKTVNEDSKADYIRARLYPATADIPFKQTEIPPSYDQTGLFLTGKTYQITAIKTDNLLFFRVSDEHGENLYTWTLTNTELVKEGRIGLRHMYTRSAQYKDITISVRP